MAKKDRVYTDAQIAAVMALHAQGKSWAQIIAYFLDQYGLHVTNPGLRGIYRRNRHQASPRLKAAMQAAKPTKKPRPVSPTTKVDNSRILVISDMHVPYQHPDTVAFLTAVKAKYKPTRVVCVGDEVDHHAMSFHDSDPDLLSAGAELQAAIRELAPLYALFPNVDLIDSNHGSMAYRKGKHHGIPRKYLREYGDVLEAPTGWVWQHDLTITLPNGNVVYFHHGLSKDVMKVVTQRGTCVVQGHFHLEFRIGYAGNPESLLWGMNVGCSIDSKSLAFAYDNTNLGRPIIGHGIIIDGQPKLLPMLLHKGGAWTGVVP